MLRVWVVGEWVAGVEEVESLNSKVTGLGEVLYVVRGFGVGV